MKRELIINNFADIRLKQPLHVHYGKKKGYLFYDNELFELHSYGKTVKELEECIKEDIVFLKELYVDADIKRLGRSASEFRATLMRELFE